MTRIDEGLSVTEYLKLSARTLDGKAWLGVCIACLLGLLDVFFNTQIIPFRDTEKPDLIATSLSLTPLITFVTLVSLRSDFLVSSKYGELCRGVVLIALFFYFHF